MVVESQDERTALKMRTFMDFCVSLSALSHDPKYQVATVILTENFREICSIGYNGDYKGGPNVRVHLEHNQSGFLHSEENALLQLNKPLELRDQLILMCTHKPCTMCAKRIVNSGIRRVIYKNEYSDVMGMTDEVFSTSGVACFSFDSLNSTKELRSLCLRRP
jgi:dCMP deaminase